MFNQIDRTSSAVELNVAILYPESVVPEPVHIFNFCNYLACKLVNSDENFKQVIRLNANIMIGPRKWTVEANGSYKGVYDLIFIFKNAKNMGKSFLSDDREFLIKYLGFLQTKGKLIHVVPVTHQRYIDFRSIIMTNYDDAPEIRVDMVPLAYQMDSMAIINYQNQIQKLLAKIQAIASQRLILAQKNQETKKDQEANSEASSNNEQEMLTVAEKTNVESDTTCADSGAILPPELLFYIFSLLSIKNVATCSLVCQSWHTITNNDKLWRHLFSKEYMVLFQGQNVKDQFIHYQANSLANYQNRIKPYGQDKQIYLTQLEEVLKGIQQAADSVTDEVITD